MDPNTQRILLGSSGAGESYWIASYSDPTYYRLPYRIAVDASNNTYVIGYGSNTGLGTVDAPLLKYNSSGNLSFQKAYGSSGSDYGTGLVTDSSGNVYITGQVSSNSIFLSKLDSSGSILWTVYSTPNSGSSQPTVDLDSSGNPVICSYYYDSGWSASPFFLQKYNPSGTLQWTAGYVRYAYSVNYQQNKCDSSGNIWFFGQWFDPSPSKNALIFGYFDSSGTTAVARSLYRSGYQTQLNGLSGWDIDTNNNICITCDSINVATALYWAPVIKVSNAFNVQWQYALYSDVDVKGYDCATDTLDNVYAVGTWTVGGVRRLFLVKYNSAGVMQWQRYLMDSGGGNLTPISVTTDVKNNIYITAQRSNTSGTLTCKLPPDGSKTGTYGSFTYGVSTLLETSYPVNIQDPGFYTISPGLVTNTYTFSSINLNGTAVTTPL